MRSTRSRTAAAKSAVAGTASAAGAATKDFPIKSTSVSAEEVVKGAGNRKVKNKKATAETEAEDETGAENILPPTVKKGTKRKTAARSDRSRTPSPSREDANPAEKKKKIVRKKGPTKKSPPKKRAARPVQNVTDRSILPRLWPLSSQRTSPPTLPSLRFLSWNVNGIRALLKNHPDVLAEVSTGRYSKDPWREDEEDAVPYDVVCLQETKLQTMHIGKEVPSDLLEAEGFDAFWSCSTAKKGYSGTVVFVRRGCVHFQGMKGEKKSEENGETSASSSSSSSKGKKKQKSISQFFSKSKNTETEKDAPLKVADSHADYPPIPSSIVSYGIGWKEHDEEGRSITLDLPHLTLTNLYVPNSGQNLVRLGYRTEKWDRDLLKFMKRKEKDRGKPVVWLGDLNVAHKAADVWNDGAKHLDKCAGTTPEERKAFSDQLEEGSGYIDAFRALHPDATGQYTYWSMRAGNKEVNKGMRLDYFVCSAAMLSEQENENNDNKADEKSCGVIVRDSSIIPDVPGSDHCPIMLELEILK
eukprot:CAMPEP_0113313114 /NCGR_PEP_ID=MMETSP0010_2-20120614/9665_1 /TAXON_ID=216773 ORGANISM="Corethron hystrix, Strain 308" /NCGR_SAMPLE_ID=MMETSP0010_2 /ASSEMBLY_ACC=CAM_ASM_000155 /LENGTH=527 /DNA_ID=CAMNT_0000169057 /DNA_START=374 /DNA_END=1957 /DNA_ORIENTATION=- /assembly_acc=CAM_ASM_000155